jgi:TPR repeat protein
MTESPQNSNLKEGLTAFEAKEYARAIAILKPLADTGDPETQCLMGNMYHLGLGVAHDLLEAVEWYKKSAEQGYGVASNNLAGIILAEAHGEPPNRREAERWYQKAREQGFLHTPALEYIEAMAACQSSFENDSNKN